MRTAITILLVFTALLATAQRQVLTVAAGEAIAAERAVYLSTGDGKVYLATDANPATGYVLEAIPVDSTGQVFQSGTVPYSVGENAGRTVYLSSTPGVLTLTKPSASYQVVGTLTDGGRMLLGFSPPIERLKQTQILASDFPNSTVTLNDVTGFSFTMEANKTYLVTFNGMAQSAATTTGLGLALDIPSGSVIGQVRHELAATTSIFHSQNADAAIVAVTTGVRAANTNFPVFGEWVVQVGVTGGACTLKMRSEIATSAVTLKGGLCALSFEKLN